MNAKEILTKRFEKATFNGYKTEDVDVFLREISNEYSQLQKEKNELERKLEVLADKIREYRDDEDALKDALLLAQKQGNQIISEAKAAAEKLKKETDEAVSKQLSDAREKSEKMKREAQEYAQRMTKDSNERADTLVKNARSEAAMVEKTMNENREIQQVILQKTRKEAEEFKNRLLAAYKAHVDLITKLPESVENEFVKAAAEEAEKREAEKAKEKAKAAPVKPAAAKPAEKTEKKGEPASAEKAEKVEKAEDEPFKSVPAEEEEAEKTGEFDLPFFSIKDEKSRKGSHNTGK